MASKKHGGNDKWLVIYHLLSGRQKLVNHADVIRKAFQKNAIDFKLIEVAYNDEKPMPDLKEVQKDYPFTKILVAGGDGGLRRVIEQQWRYDMLNIPVGFYPLGTASLVARSLNYPSKEIYLKKLLSNPESREWQLNLLNEEHVFLLGACFGRMAAFTTRTSSELKRKFGFLAYVITGTRLGYKFPKFHSHLKNEDMDVDYPNAHSLLFFSHTAAKSLLPFSFEGNAPIQLTIATHPGPLSLIKSALEVLSLTKKIPSNIEVKGLQKVVLKGDFGSKVHVDGDQLKLNVKTHTIEALPQKVTLLI